MQYGMVSRFVTGDDLPAMCESAPPFVLLHYVNYGYQSRGVPFRLLGSLRKMRTHSPGRFITVFHELYASGPPWRSAFWLRPLQRRIAQSIARLSESCVLTSGTARDQLYSLAPAVPLVVQPVSSGFGEPLLSPERISQKDPHHWLICGGTALLEKSVRSFRQVLPLLPDAFAPRQLSVVGGTDNPVVRALLRDMPNVKWSYHPRIGAAEASQIMAGCSCAWLDYFHTAAAPVDALFKSSVFAALGAHGVIPVFPHETKPLVFEEDRVPGLFFVDLGKAWLPEPEARATIGCQMYDWYHRRASLRQLTRVVAKLLGLGARPALTSS